MTKLRTLCLTAFVLCSVSVFSQDSSAIAKKDTSWKKGGFVSLMVNQISLTNWAAGGQNSFAITGLANLFANYAKGKTIWDNSLDMGYGVIRYYNENTGEKTSMRKNEDKLELNSKYGRETKTKGKWFYSALINFKSQFAPGYNYPNDSVAVSRFAAPAYLTIALGMDYKPTSYFSLFLSPATGRITFVNDPKLADAGAFGVDAAKYDAVTGDKIANGKTIKPEFGAYIRAVFQKDIMKNVNLLSKLNLFDNYTDKRKNNRANIDVSWETLLTIKANKFLSASLFTHIIYDDDIILPTYADVTINGNTVRGIVDSSPKMQFKEVLGMGLSYKF